MDIKKLEDKLKLSNEEYDELLNNNNNNTKQDLLAELTKIQNNQNEEKVKLTK